MTTPSRITPSGAPLGSTAPASTHSMSVTAAAVANLAAPTQPLGRHGRGRHGAVVGATMTTMVSSTMMAMSPP